jgi:tetratricopeptide (TPR) repeat protein
MSIETLKEQARRHEHDDAEKQGSGKLPTFDTSDDTEDELLGIYYYLARANEDLGQAERALDLYEKVFSLDINLADVTERLRDLR